MLRRGTWRLQRSNAVIAALMRMRHQYQRTVIPHNSHHSNLPRHDNSGGGGTSNSSNTNNNRRNRRADGSQDHSSRRQQQQQQRDNSASERATQTRVSAKHSGTSTGTNDSPVVSQDALSLLARDAMSLSPSEMVTLEAVRLLNKDVRPNDPLSDVAPDAPQHYCVEVGKLLGLCATFRVPTSVGRVADALAWTRRHASELTSLRQLMSIAVPLTNLPDGKTAGMEFIVEALTEPLLEALRRGRDPAVREAGGGGDSGAGERAEDETLAQRRSSVVSVLSLVTKMVDAAQGAAAAEFARVAGGGGDDADGSRKPGGLQKAQKNRRHSSRDSRGDESAASRKNIKPSSSSSSSSAFRIFSAACELEWAAVTALAQCYAPTAYTLPPLEISEAVTCVASCASLLTSLSPPIASPGTSAAGPGQEVRRYLLTEGRKTEDPLRSERLATVLADKVAECQRQLAPIVREALQPRAAAATPRTSDLNAFIRAVAATPASSATATAVRQGGLPEDELLTSALLLLPASLSTASARDISLLLQTLNKLRAERPRLPPWQQRTFVDSLVSAVRPRLFYVAEAQHSNQQLRQVESSTILLHLARLCGGADAATRLSVPDDLVELLCKRFAASASSAMPNHVLMFLQGLQRIQSDGLYTAAEAAEEQGRQRQRGGQRRQPLLWSLPQVSVALDRCAERCRALVQERQQQGSNDDAAIQAATAAQMLGVLAVLGYEECDTLFDDMEPALTEYLQELRSDKNVEVGDDESDEQHSQRVTQCGNVVQALDRFLQHIRHRYEDVPTAAAAAASVEGEGATSRRARAEALRQQYVQVLVGELSSLKTPKQLVVLDSLLHAPTHRSDLSDDTATATATATATPPTSDSGRTIAIFLRRCVDVAPLCSSYEAAALCWAVARAPEPSPAEALGDETTTTASASATSIVAAATRREAMVALLERSKHLRFTAADAKRVLDAVRLADCGVAAPDSVLQALTAADSAEVAETDATTQTAAALDGNRTLHSIVNEGRTLLAYYTHLLDDASRDHISGESVDSGLSDNDHSTQVLRSFQQFTLKCHQALGKLVADSEDAETQGSMMEDLSTLAFVLANQQKLCLSCSPAAADGESEVDAVKTETEEADAEQELEDARDETAPRALESRDTDSISAVRAYRKQLSNVMTTIGDAVNRVVEERRMEALFGADGELDAEGDDDEKGGGVADEPLYAQQPAMSPKQAVLLLQAFDATRVVHQELLYNILQQVVLLAPSIPPLELSLAITALTKLGVWNARLMRRLSHGAAAQVGSQSQLRECVGVLQGLLHSGFLSTDEFFQLPRSSRAGGDAAHAETVEDWRSATAAGTGELSFTSESTLRPLAAAAVERLDGFVKTRAAFDATQREGTFEELLSVVRMLGTFSSPPQPTYDAYCLLSTRALVRECRACQSEAAKIGGHGGHSNQQTPLTRRMRSLVVGATLLLPALQRMSHFRHQKVSSRCAMAALERMVRAAASSSVKLWPTILPDTLTKLYTIHQTGQLLYDAKLSGCMSLCAPELARKLTSNHTPSSRAAYSLQSFCMADRLFFPLMAVDNTDGKGRSFTLDHTLFVDTLRPPLVGRRWGSSHHRLPLREALQLCLPLSGCLADDMCVTDGDSQSGRNVESSFHQLLTLAAETLERIVAFAAIGGPNHSINGGIQTMSLRSLLTPAVAADLLDLLVSVSLSLHHRCEGGRAVQPEMDKRLRTAVRALMPIVCEPLIRNKNLSVSTCVSTLLNYVRLLEPLHEQCRVPCYTPPPSSSAAEPAELVRAMIEALHQPVVFAAQSLVGDLQKSDATGLGLLSHVNHLLTFNVGLFGHQLVVVAGLNDTVRDETAPSEPLPDTAAAMKPEDERDGVVQPGNTAALIPLLRDVHYRALMAVVRTHRRRQQRVADCPVLSTRARRQVTALLARDLATRGDPGGGDTVPYVKRLQTILDYLRQT